MKERTVSIKHLKIVSAFLTGALITLCSATNVSADPLTPEIQAKADHYKQKLVEWAKNPAIIAAVKESNSKGGLVHDMSNAKWEELKDADPVVKGFQTSAAGKFVSAQEDDKGIGKLYARDEKGNLVASSNKPALFNIAVRAPFKNAITGKAFVEAEVKADPTTQKKSVQVSVPIMSDGKPIGVLHTAVNAN